MNYKFVVGFAGLQENGKQGRNNIFQEVLF
jgi:hypothetical protein